MYTSYDMVKLSSFENILQHYPDCWKYTDLTFFWNKYHIHTTQLQELNTMLLCARSQEMPSHLRQVFQNLGKVYRYGQRQEIQRFINYYQYYYSSEQIEQFILQTMGLSIKISGNSFSFEKKKKQHYDSGYQPLNEQKVEEKIEKQNIETEISEAQLVSGGSIERNGLEEKKVEEKEMEKEKNKYSFKYFSISEIKRMVEIANVDELRKDVSQKTIEDVEQMKKRNRVKQTIEVTEVPDKYKTKRSNYEKKPNPKGNEEITFGSKKTKEEKAPSFDIILGGNKTLEETMERNKLKKEAAERNFAKEKEEEILSLTEIEQGKREINYNLNLIAPENLKEIYEKLKRFGVENKQMCEAFIEEIIEKAWIQQKYAASYAKLCLYFTKLSETEFKFKVNEEGEGEKKEKKKKQNNQFKQLLLEKVQATFDEKKKEEQAKEDTEQGKKERKKKLIYHAQFVAELIKSKVLPKKIIRYCILVLLERFLEGHYLFVKSGDPSNQYTFHFEALIRFLQILGERFEAVNEEKKNGKIEECQAWVSKFCEAKQQPKENMEEIQRLFSSLNADEYFGIFDLIDQKILKIKDNRLSSLLKNLQERKNNKWQKHHVEAEGPKKLKDLQKEEEEYTKEDAEKEMKKILKSLEEDESLWKKLVDKMKKKSGLKDMYFLYMKLAAEDKKQVVLKRLVIFSYFIEKDFKEGEFYNAWKEVVVEMSFLASEIPFAAAFFAKVLTTMDKEYEKVDWKKYHIKFDQNEEEDEWYFMEDVYQKVYHYEEKEEVRKIITGVKSKLSKLI